MPTLEVARGESRKKEAGTHIDFGALWEVTSGLIQDEVSSLPLSFSLLLSTVGTYVLLLLVLCSTNLFTYSLLMFILCTQTVATKLLQHTHNHLHTETLFLSGQWGLQIHRLCRGSGRSLSASYQATT